MNGESFAKFLAELINGGSFDDPRSYNDEQRELWRGHAEAARGEIVDVMGLARIASQLDQLRGAADIPMERAMQIGKQADKLMASITQPVGSQAVEFRGIDPTRTSYNEADDY